MEVLEPKNFPLFLLEPFAITITIMATATSITPVIIFLPYLSFNKTIFYL